MDTKTPAVTGPDERRVRPDPDRAAFEVWAIDQGFPIELLDGMGGGLMYRDLRTQVAWDGFCVCAAAERERWEKALRMLRDAVVSQNRSGASWDERVFGPMMGGLALAAELLDGPNV